MCPKSAGLEQRTEYSTSVRDSLKFSDRIHCLTDLLLQIHPPYLFSPSAILALSSTKPCPLPSTHTYLVSSIDLSH